MLPPSPDAPTDVRGEAVGAIVMTFDELLALRLEEEEAYLLTFLDGQCSVDTIAPLARMPAAQARAVLTRLVALGAVELRGAARATRVS